MALLSIAMAEEEIKEEISAGEAFVRALVRQLRALDEIVESGMST